MQDSPVTDAPRTAPTQAMDCDLLIAGQGLAGTLLAWQAHRAGLRVTIADPDESETASRVAAGIINPITGHRLARSWRFDEFYPVARDFYRGVEQELGRTFYHPRTILRCLDSEESFKLWQRRIERAEYRQLCATDSQPGRPADPGWFLPCPERFASEHCGFLEIEAFLRASRRFFARHHRVLEEALDPAVLELPGGRRGIRYRGISAARAVLCLGAGGRDARFFGSLPLRAAKGEVLEVELRGCSEQRIINRGGKWLLPTGRDRFLVGATYLWNPPDSLPSSEGRDEISAALESILARPPVVLRHRAGVRPVIRGSRPVLGWHPAHPAIGIFNGLGSKGVLNGPYFAHRLVRHLVADEALDPETDVRAYL